MAIEIVDLPSYKMVIFHSYVSLPEGKHCETHRVVMGFKHYLTSYMEPTQYVVCHPKVVFERGLCINSN